MIITTTNHYSDTELVYELQSGNSGAMSLLYNRYYAKVYAKCYTYLKNTDDAFDTAQDIIIKAYTRIGTFKGYSSFSTWLFALTTNHCISLLRKKNVVQYVSELDPFSDTCIGCDEVDRVPVEQQEIALDKLLNEISETDRQILVMKYEEKCSIRELQGVFNLSSSAIKMRLLRSKKKIEKQYQKLYCMVQAC
jgi:RNA polymerase sigma-70 factor (ECF subfamily)